MTSEKAPPEIWITKLANAALAEQWQYYEALRGPALSRRWIRAVSDAIYSLRSMTERGTPYRSAYRELRGVRWIRVPKLPFRIFYQFSAAENTVRILHLIHDKRKIEDLLLEAVDEGVHG